MSHAMQVLEEKVTAIESEVRSLRYFMWYIVAIITARTGVEFAPKVITVVLEMLKYLNALN